MNRDIFDYYQLGAQMTKPIADRMARDRAGRIAASLAESGQFNDPAMSDPRVQDALGAMMSAERGTLGIQTGDLTNKLTALKLLDAMQNPGGNSMRSGAGGMIYDSRSGKIIREPDPKMMKSPLPYSAVSGGVLNRETGEVKPTVSDPLKNYPQDDRGTILMAGDLAVDEAKRTAGGFLDPLDEQRVREEGQTQAKKRIYDRQFDPTFKKNQKAVPYEITVAEKQLKAAHDAMTAQQNLLISIKRNPNDPDSYTRHAEQTKRVQAAEAEYQAAKQRHTQALGGAGGIFQQPQGIPLGGAAPADILPAPGALQPQTGYIPGKRYRGMTYLGGDPNNRASWQ